MDGGEVFHSDGVLGLSADEPCLERRQVEGTIRLTDPHGESLGDYQDQHRHKHPYSGVLVHQTTGQRVKTDKLGQADGKKHSGGMGCERFAPLQVPT